jgi:hypothetical protein
MCIPTVQSLRRQAARIDRRRRAADRVVAAMRDGAALRCSHERSGVVWWLSNGRSVSPEIAKFVIVNADIMSVGDSLFRNVPAQTFCFVNKGEHSCQTNPRKN